MNRKMILLAAVWGFAFGILAADWLSVPEASVCTNVVRDGSRAADGTSWFAATYTNAAEVVAARWTVAGLGVFDVYVNGTRVGDDFLKPGFTHYAKTKYSFSYDVTALMKTAKDAANCFAAEVSAGWWRDKIVTPAAHQGFIGRKSAFRGELKVKYADSSQKVFETCPSDWRCGICGPITHAAIFDGEEYDARNKPPFFGEGLESVPEVNGEFKGELLPTAGAEVCLRRDKTMNPVAAYVWEKTAGASDSAFGTVVKTRAYEAGDAMRIAVGEKLVLDFGQNAAAVPFFRFRAKRGTVLTALPAEMLNDGNGDKKRGNDGPEGSVYRANLRDGHDTGRLVKYTFAGEGLETYMSRFTFFGYRYMSVSATDEVEIETVRSVPVTSIGKDLELGRVETGSADINRLVRNIYWGQLSNYLSVPTDCPQRNERLGWAADTQAFCEAGTFNADTSRFFRKWLRDLRDSRCREGGYPSAAPYGQYGNETFNFGWADAGVIVPWTIWKQFGDVEILRENYAAMCQFVRKVAEKKYDFEGQDDHSGRFDKMYLYADWLSFEKFETCGNRFGSWKKWKNDPEAMEYRRYLAACFWLYDARILSQMAAALGRDGDVGEFTACAASAEAYIRSRFFESDGLLRKSMRDLQTACVFALHLNLVTGETREATKRILLDSIAAHDGCIQTGFLGTMWIMDALTEADAVESAYSLLLNHKHPSWLYSVDQGATTVWERWNSYTKKDGFGPVDMNSFNHYAYGAVLAWIYKTAAGIAADLNNPGFRNIIMAPKPDRRLGFVKAEYKSAAGLVKSEWKYEGEKWIWRFTIPEGATADVTVPGDEKPKRHLAGSYEICR